MRRVSSSHFPVLQRTAASSSSLTPPFFFALPHLEARRKLPISSWSRSDATIRRFAMPADALTQEYRDAVHRFLRRRVADPSDAEDLLQDVLLKVHQALPGLDPATPLKPWLYRIARNASVDFYRRRSRQKGAAALHPEDLWYGGEPEAAHDLDRCIEPMIRRLPEPSAALLRRIDLEGQSQRDYAAERGLAYSTVKSRVQSARAELRRLFGQCCHFGLDAQGNVMDYTRKSDTCKDC
jgi:RNA polymerase sigma-70 factor (ECF subfamily)